MATSNPTTPKKTEEVFVALNLGQATINYAYNMPKATFTDLKTDLGITEVTDQTSLFYGINAPKPYRATKITEKESVISAQSSFVSSNKLSALRGKPNYNLSAPKGSLSISGNPNIVTVYIPIPAATGTVKYLWNMKKSVFDLVGEQLGIKKASKNDLDEAIKGLNRPTLPRATKRISGVTRSTFVDPAKMDDAEAKGWNTSKGTIQLATSAPAGG